MKRGLVLLASAAAAIAVSSAPTQAAYEIIRWRSGYCEILDQSSPVRPWSNDFRRGKRTFRTYGEATTARARLIALRQCAG
jgi:hypothetical protein